MKKKKKPYIDRTNKAKIWQIIRGLRKFEAVEITVLSEAPHHNVQRYLQILLKAGYLRVAGKNRYKYTYQLVKDTGILPPAQKEILVMFDPNTNEYWIDNKKLKKLLPGLGGDL